MGHKPRRGIIVKKANKLFLAIGSVAAIAAPLFAVVSCGETKQIKNGNGVSYVTDGGTIADRGFNEESWAGANDFVGVINKSNSGYTSELIEPKALTTEGFAAAYDLIKGNDIVLSGFRHDDKTQKYGDVRTWHKNHPDKNIVAIDIADGGVSSGEAVDNGDKFYGVTFKTRESGFIAAIEAGYMLNVRFPLELGTIKVATFGARNISDVTEYMNGFVAGVNWFNKNKQGFARNMELVHIDNNDLSKDFSGNFDEGGATAISEAFIAKKVHAIFPVAGIQSADVVNAIKAKDKIGETFLIGIDTEQSRLFGDVVLTSAIKGVRKATVDMLKKIHGLSDIAPSDKIYSMSDGDGFVGAEINPKYKDLLPEEEIMSTAKKAATHSLNFEGENEIYHPTTV